MPFFKTNDDVNIHYEIAGTGKTLVMIHGFGPNSKVFFRNVEELSQKYQVVTVDLRGHGESDRVSYGLHMARLAKDVYELLVHLDLHDVTLLGHSMGCSVIWGYWCLYRSERLSKLILADQAPCGLAKEDNPYGTHKDLGAFAKSFSSGGKAASGASMFDDPEIYKLYEPIYDEANARTRSEYIKEALALHADHNYNDWRDVIPTINIPTLVLANSRNNVVQIGANQWTHEHIKDSKFIIMEGGHAFPQEKYQEFDRIVAEFIG